MTYWKLPRSGEVFTKETHKQVQSHFCGPHWEAQGLPRVSVQLLCRAVTEEGRLTLNVSGQGCEDLTDWEASLDKGSGEKAS